jgi:ADP-heptose:LPS heptosyltransferase
MSLLTNVDPFLTGPAVVAGLVIRWVFGVLFRIRCWVGLQPTHIKDEKLCVVRPGGMGDLILLTLAAERAGFQKSRIFFLIEKRSAPWARFLGLNFVCYDGTDRQQILKRLGTFSVVVNSEQRYGLAHAMAVSLLAPKGELLCFNTNRGVGWAKTFLISQKCVAYSPVAEHEVDAFGRLLEDCNDVADPHTPKWSATFSSKLYTVLAIGGCQSPSRSFDVDFWVSFAKKHAVGKTLVTAAPADIVLAEKVCQRLESSLVEGGFAEVCEVVASASRVLTIDSGAVHMASYFGVQTVAVFTSGVLPKWAPLAQGSKVFKRNDLLCQPCTRFGAVPPCPISYKCKDISI